MKHIKLFKRLILLFLYVIIALSAFNVYEYYIYSSENPQTLFEIKPGDDIPEEALIKIEMSNKIRLSIGIGLALVGLFFWLEYKEDPENHFSTKFINYIRRLQE